MPTMGYDWLVPLLAALADLVIAGAVLWKRGRDHGTRVFAGMATAIASWNFGIFALNFFDEPASAEWWSRVARIGICLAPALAFHVTLQLAEIRGRRWWTMLRVGYVAAGVLALLDAGGFLVAGVVPHRWGWYPVPTRPYAALTVLLVTYSSLSVALVWHAWRHPSSERQRVRAGCWLVAAAVQVPFIFTNLLPLYGIDIYPLGSLGNVAFVAILAWAIVRHRFLDVDWLVRKVTSFTLAAGVVLVPGALGVAELATALGAADPVVIACSAAALALAAAVVIPAVQRGLETRIQQMLFPNRWDARRRLTELGALLVHELEEERLLRQLGETLHEILGAEQCTVLVRDDATRGLRVSWPTTPAPLAVDEGLLARLEPLAAAALADELPIAVASRLRELGWAAVLPLRVHDRLTGLVALGEAHDMSLHSADTLRLLDGVGASASVALENCRLSRELRRSEAVLQRANQLSSLGQLAAGIAHEIRNPLVAVKTFLDLLPQRLEDKAFLTTFRELSLNELRRVTDLISDLLTLGKGSAPDRGEVDVGGALDGVVRLMASTARKRNVEVDARFPSGLPPVWADGGQLKQVALNLVLNAIEASPPGSIVRVSAEDAGDMVALLVQDQGPGIAREHLETIFEPFFTTKESGTGLGLALVHQMVVEHGGQITVDSTVGVGSTFRVTVPVARAALRRTGS